MDTYEFSCAVLGSFVPFVREQSLDELPPDEHTCLADYIYTWVLRGGGAEVCGRDFSALQFAVQVIANHWHHYETTLDYVPSGHSGNLHVFRRVRDIFPTAYAIDPHPILDPNIFA